MIAARIRLQILPGLESGSSRLKTLAVPVILQTFIAAVFVLLGLSFRMGGLM